MQLRNLMRILAVVAAVMAASTAAHANVAVPSLMGMSWIGMVLVLIPIILIEAIAFWLKVDIAFLSALWVATVSNLASTLIGIPVASVVLLGYRQDGIVNTETKLRWRNFVATVFDAIWLNSFELRYYRKNARIVNWALAIGGWVILAMFFLASWATEYVVGSYMLSNVSSAAVNVGILVANAVTYGLIAIPIALLMSMHMSEIDLSEQRGSPAQPRVQERDWHKGALARPDRWQTANYRAHAGMRILREAEIGVSQTQRNAVEPEVSAEQRGRMAGMDEAA